MITGPHIHSKGTARLGQDGDREDFRVEDANCGPELGLLGQNDIIVSSVYLTFV